MQRHATARRIVAQPKVAPRRKKKPPESGFKGKPLLTPSECEGGNDGREQREAGQAVVDQQADRQARQAGAQRLHGHALPAALLEHQLDRAHRQAVMAFSIRATVAGAGVRPSIASM